MRRAVSLLIVLLVFTTLPAVLADRHTVVYFYRNYCESCTPEEDFAQQFLSLSGVRLEDCDFSAWNVVRSDGQAAFEKAQAEYALENAALPLAVVDGVVYAGAGEMNTNLAETALSWQDPADSMILYLYTPGCSTCAAAEAVLEELPESVELPRGILTVPSRVVIQKMDISAMPEFAQALCDAYQIPDDKRVTPAVFFGNHYLTGEKDIREKLLQEVLLGWASDPVRIPDEETVARYATHAPVLASIGAGIVAGLNTCALSMLLLFLSLILPSGRKAPAIVFLGAKLVCYLLIGFLLQEIFRSVNPQWMAPFARIMMTLFGVILIAVNLWDAWHAAHGQLGAIMNQLPAGLRGRLQRLIRSMLSSRALLPAAALLGFLVAGGEFMCAGQLYLMQLLGGLKYTQGQGLSLIAYCLAFLLPSGLVCAVVYLSQSILKTATFFSDHIVAVKVITSIAMVGLILAAWLL